MLEMLAKLIITNYARVKFLNEILIDVSGTSSVTNILVSPGG